MATEIQIDGQSYPLYVDDPRVSPWSVTERGQKVEWERRHGFLGGAGHYVSERGDDYLMASNMDGITFPYLRLKPTGTGISLPGSDTLNFQAYVFIEQDSGGANYAYVLNAQYAWKIALANNTSGTRKDFGAGAVCGRPRLFKGKWHIPLGDSVDYVTLDTIAVGNSANADTWTTVVGQKARHFARIQKIQQQMLARAYNSNLIDLSANGTAWTGDNFEIPTAKISDLLEAFGELIISSAEGIFLMNPDGQAVNLLVTGMASSSERDPAANFVGANGWQHGAYTYWPHSSGLWRFIGQQGQAVIGPESDPQFVNRTLDGVSFLPSAAWLFWRSVTAVNAWIYATHDIRLFAGRIHEDGSVTWHGAVRRTPAQHIICYATEGDGPSSSPILWLITSGNADRIALASDGSLRHGIGGGRGSADTTHQVWLPEVRAPRRAQWRVMWVELEGDWGANQPVQLGAHIDGFTASQNVGAVITANGRTERAWTPGVADLADFIIPTLKVVTTAGYVTSNDPRIRAWGGWGIAPQVYRCVIDLRPKTLADRSQQWDFRGALRVLRTLVDAEGKTIIEPDTERSFLGYVESMDEQRRDGGAIVSLRILNYEIHAAP